MTKAVSSGGSQAKRSPGSSATRRPSLALALAFLALSALLAWDRHADYQDDQHQLMMASATGAAHEIGIFIRELYGSVRVFAYEERALIAELATHPDDEERYNALKKKIQTRFPDIFAFTVADRDGNPLLEDFDGLVDEYCRADIRSFAQDNRRRHVAIHPNPLVYHFDIMAPWSIDPREAGVFFISFYPDVLARLLASHQLPQQRLILLRRDKPELIEVTSEGARNQLQRDITLDKQETARIGAMAPVYGTLWNLVVIPDEHRVSSELKWMLREVAPMLSGFVAVGLLTLWFVRRAARQRQAAVQSWRLSEERLQSILDNSTAVVYVKDLAGHFELVNQHWATLFHVAREQIVGKTDYDIYPNGIADAFRANDRKVVEQNAPLEYEESVPQDDGLHTYLSIKFPLYDAAGKINAVCGISTDITERKQAEEELKRTRDELQTILDHLPAYIFYKDTKNVIVRANKKAANSLGLTPNEMAGKHTHLFYPEHADAYYQDDLEVIRGGTPKLGIIEPFRVTGDQTRWIETNKVPIRDANGAVTGILMVASDITQRMRAEQEMTRMRLRLKNIIDSMPSVLVGVDLEGRITEFNRQAEQRTGFSQDQAQGRLFCELFPQLKAQAEQIRQAIQKREPIRTERRIHEIDGETRYSDVMVYPLIANGPVGAVIRMDDVTARVRIEEMMEQTEKMLSVGGLAAGMAHEINNPLGAMMQSGQNIRRRLSPELAKNREVAETLGMDLGQVQTYLEARGIPRFLEDIHEAGARAAKIVADMLAFSRRSESRFAPINLGELLDTAVRLAAIDYDFKKNYDFKQIEIERDYDPTVGEVPCDPAEIEQVILNLLKNAAQAMTGTLAPQQPPKIILRTRQQANYARIEIIDNGPGMDEKTRRRVFEPFFTTKDVGVGTGLGLSVSYFIVTEQHRGTLTVESAPDKGARFIICLPTKKA